MDLRSQLSTEVPYLLLWDKVYATEKPVFGHALHSQEAVPLRGQPKGNAFEGTA